MDLFNQSLSVFGVVRVLVAAILLFGAFRLLKKLADLPRFRVERLRLVSHFLPLLELLAWAVLGVWAGRKLFPDVPLFANLLFALIVGLLVWGGRFAIADVIAGIVLKLEDGYQIGDGIKLEGISGVINSVGLRSLEIVNDGGENVRIPYGRIAGQQRIVAADEERAAGHQFQVEMPARMPASNGSALIESLVLNAPWSSLGKGPNVRLVQEGDELNTYEVTVYLIGDAEGHDIEKYVEKRLEEMS